MSSIAEIERDWSFEDVVEANEILDALDLAEAEAQRIAERPR